jgi:hypothetical protein
VNWSPKDHWPSVVARVAAQEAARLLPGRAAPAALAARHDLSLGRRAGSCSLKAAIDCCTREIVAWQLELRCRADEAIALVERAGELGLRHRRGGYRDPRVTGLHRVVVRETKREREGWLNEYETLDDARRGIGGHVDR